MIVLLTFIIALGKALIDAYRWPFKNHWIGFIISGILIIAVCFLYNVIYPIFLFNVFFNPFINILKDLPIFYIGKTSILDEILLLLFKDYAGEVWFFTNIILTALSALIF